MATGNETPAIGQPDHHDRTRIALAVGPQAGRIVRRLQLSRSGAHGLCGPLHQVLRDVIDIPLWFVRQALHKRPGAFAQVFHVDHDLSLAQDDDDGPARAFALYLVP